LDVRGKKEKNKQKKQKNDVIFVHLTFASVVFVRLLFFFLFCDW